MGAAGYVTHVMGDKVTELRLPADREHILVAKRSAAAIGTLAGFDVDAIDDLGIAVSQAVENAIGCLERAGVLAGQVRITFKLNQRGLEVNVRSTLNREEEMEARARAARLEQTRQAERLQRQQEQAAAELALRLMGLFVDDHSYRIDERTGGFRVRLTKYRVS